MDVLLIAILLGLIPAAIAYKKGRNVFVWWMYGSVLFVVALPHVLFIRSVPFERERPSNRGPDNMPATCPYCRALLSKVPKRKASCPFCKNEIYVRAKQDIFPNRSLFTEEDARALDWLKRLQVSRRDFEAHREDLSKQFGFTAKATDVVWRIMNASLKPLARTKDFHELKMMYLQMAQFVYDEGKDPLRMKQLAVKTEIAELRHSAKQGFINLKSTRLEVITSGEASCGECRKLHKAVFTIDQALEQMPIPVRGCTHNAVKEGEPGWCRCCYGQVFEA